MCEPSSGESRDTVQGLLILLVFHAYEACRSFVGLRIVDTEIDLPVTSSLRTRGPWECPMKPHGVHNIVPNEICVILASDVVYALLCAKKPYATTHAALASTAMGDVRLLHDKGRKTKERTTKARKKKGALGVPEHQ